ncbi:hypothetical protein IV203_011694 [Nitzschia inconspicua]|uniref:Uncharacterized protein n=1 Tax=Nitzschia inconspicua TaxID=303405 RepID=A0A9K3KSU4_9STRA|nr:hypothetical protein IV203_011694 [Nitzschia inconspicua]
MATITPFDSADSPLSQHSIEIVSISFLPTEILKTILKHYCDGYTLNQFWLAAVTCRRKWKEVSTKTFQEVLCSILAECVASRAKYIHDRLEKHDLQPRILRLNDLTCDPTQSFSKLCFAIDFYESVPWNIIWCGTLHFRDPSASRPFDANSSLVEQGVKVLIITLPKRWRESHAHGWFEKSKKCFTNNKGQLDTALDHEYTAIELVLQKYNFLTVAPHGRIIGVTKEDKQALERMSRRMQQNDLVGTLPTSYRNRGSNTGNPDYFVCRVVSFAQAKEKVEQVLGSAHGKFNEETKKMEPTSPITLNDAEDLACKIYNDVLENQKFSFNDDDSLYCSWECEYEDPFLNRPSPLFVCYREYSKLFGVKSLW